MSKVDRSGIFTGKLYIGLVAASQEQRLLEVGGIEVDTFMSNNLTL